MFSITLLYLALAKPTLLPSWNTNKGGAHMLPCPQPLPLTPHPSYPTHREGNNPWVVVSAVPSSRSTAPLLRTSIRMAPTGCRVCSPFLPSVPPPLPHPHTHDHRPAHQYGQCPVVAKYVIHSSQSLPCYPAQR
jgi:hypothetical protein